MQAWQEGSRVADFSLQSNRTDALQLLMKLHATGELVNWQATNVLPEAKSLLKWQFRLARFQQEMPALAYYLPNNILLQLEEYGKRALEDIRKAESKLASSKKTLLHGDVVHHNFLICSNQRMHLIDFDLAQLGEPEDELILWLHRVLPNIDYRLSEVMDEQTSLQVIPKEKLHRLKYPNELLREWLFILTLNRESLEPFLEYLYPFTESALTFWPELWYDSERYAKK